MSKELDKLLGDWMTATNDGNLKNKIAEEIGELCADQEIKRRFGARLQRTLAIPRRGEEGVVILDIAYELEGNAYVVAESKFFTSQRGKLVQRIIASDDVTGEAQLLNVEGGITQLEGRWLSDRIAEIRKKDYLLADKLDSAWKNLRLTVLEVRTVPEINAGKAVIKEIVVKDETETANRFIRGLPVERTVKQKLARDISKKLAFDKSAADTTTKIAKDLRAKADKANAKADKLREKAQKSRRDAGATEKPHVKATREKVASDAEKASRQADEEARLANETAVGAENKARALANATGAADKQKILDAIKNANQLEVKAAKAAKKSAKAAEDLANAKDFLGKAKRSDSRRRRGKLVQDAETFAKTAEEEAQLAKQAADLGKQQLEQLVGHDPRGTASNTAFDKGTQTTATDARIVKGGASPSPADRNAVQKAEEVGHPQQAARTAEDAAAKKAADEAAARKASATLNKANTAKGLENKATASKGLLTASQAEKDLKAGAKSLELAEAGEKALSRISKAEHVFAFAFKGARLLTKVGKFIFLALDVTGLNILGDLLMLVDLVDIICDWLQREKLAREREWKRIVDYLFGETHTITSDYDVPYETSIRGWVLGSIQGNIITPASPQNLMFWLDKWNNDSTWDGFVYSQVEVRLEKQARQNADSDEALAVKYRRPNGLTITLTATPPEDTLKETAVGTALESDESNMTTKGKIYPNPDRVGSRRWPVYNVDKSWLDIRFTQPIPCLTPFDFILVKCRMLSSAIIGFVSKYDGLIDKNIDDLISEDFVDQFLKQDIFQGRTFKKPLNDAVIHDSMRFLFDASKQLSQHGVQAMDFTPYPPMPTYNIGLMRRQQILFRWLQQDGGEVKSKLAGALGGIAERESAADLVKPVDPELKGVDAQYLYDLATEIHADLKRAFRDTQKRPFVYQYKGPEKRIPKASQN